MSQSNDSGACDLSQSLDHMEASSPTIVDADGLPQAVKAVIESKGGYASVSALCLLIDSWGERQRRAALANQPAPTVPADALREYLIENFSIGDSLAENHAETILRKFAHQPAQEQAEPQNLQCAPSVGFFVCGEQAECTECKPNADAAPALAAQQEPVAAPQIIYSAPITVSSMTLRKREFLEQKGYSVVGYVMQDAKNERCTVAHGNVMWETVPGKD